MVTETSHTGRRIRVRGQVQGVGFRPFIWRLARELGLTGVVYNDAEGVLIDIFGDAIETFITRLHDDAPDVSEITSITHEPIPFAQYNSFEIGKSVDGIAQTRVTPDLATCPDCSAEIHDPNAHRHGYAFTNCTNCGPRFSIVQDLPYDRGNTTMAAFELCPHCATQYDDPADRRFHAQPIACPDCGPEIEYHGARGPQAIAAAVADLRAGKIVAIKGLGGFHLAVDAQNAQAIAQLRLRKHRPSKPLALMADIAVIECHATIDNAARAALTDRAAPIVLLPHSHSLPEVIAPGQNQLGWMLPYTPLHQLLVNAFEGILVMSSANLSGEPQVIDNDEATAKLGDIADRFLMHNRPIARRIDDSVVQIFQCAPMILRRARGYTPSTIALPDGFEDAPQTLGLGGLLKSTICFLKNGEALMTHHLGDLDNLPTIEEYERAHCDYRQLFAHDTELVAVDMHSAFYSRQYGEGLGLPVIEVQHHHAHMAAVMAEHHLPRDHAPVVGIILDGLGAGTDGTIWGGEVLLGDYREFTRLGHLKPAPLMGGDAANREPWRNALARLDDAGLSTVANRLFTDYPRNALRAAAKAGVNAPLSSSMGRLFDAFAALIGFDGPQSYEGEAATKLQSLAETVTDAAPYQMTQSGGVFDPSPLFAEWHDRLGEESPALQAARFHAGVALSFAKYARQMADENDTKTIALSGGVIQNRLLLGMLLRELDGYHVIYPRAFPANDGGLSLGQAVIAAAKALSGGY